MCCWRGSGCWLSVTEMALCGSLLDTGCLNGDALVDLEPINEAETTRDT
jgi:hypothetical protein